MFIKDIIERIKYPDEKEGISFDTLDYNDVVGGLIISLSSTEGQLKKDLQETLDEIQRRWAERQKMTLVS